MKVIMAVANRVPAALRKGADKQNKKLNKIDKKSDKVWSGQAAVIAAGQDLVRALEALVQGVHNFVQADFVKRRAASDKFKAKAAAVKEQQDKARKLADGLEDLMK